MVRLRIWLTLVGLIALASIATGCGFAGGDDSAKDGLPDEVSIGFLGPLTGEYAIYGDPAYKAAQLAAEEWNAKGGLRGSKIKLERADSQGDPKQAATLARRFVDQDVEAILGPTFSAEAEAAVPILCQNDITAISSLADLIDPNGSPCYFRTSPREDIFAAFAARLITDYLHADTVALIDDGKSDTVRTAELVKKALEGKADVAFSGSVTAGRQDYSSTLTKVKGLDADVVFLASTLPEAAIMRKQGTDLGIDTKWVTAAGTAEPAFRKVVGDRGTPTITYNPARPDQAYGDFAAAYEKRFGEQATNFNEYAYDAANILFTAIKKAGSLDSAKVTDQLKAIDDFPGVTGGITFDDTGSRSAEQFDTLRYGDDQKWSVVEDVPFNSP